MDRWKGRVALVTGASAGIGAAIAYKLAKCGMKVVACARNITAIEAMRDELAPSGAVILPVKCDLRKEEDILAMFATVKEKFGGVDVCVNNAGLAFDGDSLVDGSSDHWRNMLEVNVLAYSIVARESVRSMRSRGVDDGHLIYINSDSGHYVMNYAWVHFYECTKHAVTAQVEGMRRELRLMNSHIRTTAICPGWVNTEFVKRAAGGGEKGEAFHKECLDSGNQPLNPEDVADAAIYALGAPPHVQVFQLMLYGTEESVAGF